MRMTRCVCGHPAAAHEHYRDGSDCGACGRFWCPWYISLGDRDTLAGLMTPEQRILLAESDAQAHRIIATLAEFQPGYRERALALVGAIPAQRRVPTIAREMEVRRSARNARSHGDKGVAR